MYLRTCWLYDLPKQTGVAAAESARWRAVDDDPKRHARRQIADGGRRLRALRLLLGDRSPAELAQRVNIDGLGKDTLTNIESASRSRELWDYEAVAIARAVGVPPSYFTAPLAYLGDVRESSSGTG